ncbi:sarcosine oxidase subunit alpha family protein [Derxia gummosa]|uniref:Sarcosine oxidase subunit alpha family protein n=1 Tax=Derxia gummosa DSM 723 TaxID=1121388 RepID=A0A8B6X1J1_9BURK|nr:sarcosine oxidase subunit alpha family protein [Derxia gummosa]
MSGYRVKGVSSARIDWKKEIAFTFDGERMFGHPGDTLASALIANGTGMLARSFKYGRPRGIYGAGPEEPNALMQIETGARTVPNLKATQVELYDGLTAARTTGRPSLGFDLKSIGGKFAQFMPAGFYYKTFKWPLSMWPTYEKVIRAAAGYGTVPTEFDPDRYDHLHHHVDVLVVGGGACGLLAALMAGRAGKRVLLVDEQNELGGWLLSMPDVEIDGKASALWLDRIVAELRNMANVTLLPRTTAFALHDMNMVQAVELCQDHLPLIARSSDLPRERLHRIRAERVVLASGAIERPLVFADNDRPGVMTAAAATTYLNRYAVAAGRKALVMTNNDFAYRGAINLAQAGVAVTLADLREAPGQHWLTAASKAGVEVLRGHGIVGVKGSKAVQGAQLARFDGSRNAISAGGPAWSGDLILSSGGLSPTVHLFCHNGARPVWDANAHAFVVPEQGRGDISCVGSITGAFLLRDALKQTEKVMRGLVGGNASVGIATDEPGVGATRRIFRVTDGKPEGHGAKAFVDFQNDVAASDIHLSVRENYKAVEHVKRYTGLGFGTDQGKLSNVNGFGILAEALGVSMSEVGTTTYRPAYTPVTFGALAGAHAKETFDPERFTSAHQSHVRRGAEFEVVGQWQRPWYFPKGKEDMHAAVKRECLAARNGVAVMDASTLGKIDLRGPDVREFLNRVYANAWSQLAVGKCRYGLMLDENGMVMDDGVTACIADDHFLMTTTTGGAARVLNWLEKWHQTEWPELKVYMTSVTDHWSTTSVVGPKARAVLQKLCSDIDFGKDTFKFMDWRAGTVAGVPARVYRISFSGELAYEINVDANYGEHIWEAVMEAGAEFDITPYGTESMHVLRAEKGFIIVGQDTDGSVTPFDLDMSWAVSMKKSFSFIGKRSMARADTQRADRKQLVGLLTDNPNEVLAEGAQIIAAPAEAPGVGGKPVPMLGHVTSSYFSPTLGRSIAMAVVKGGIKRKGETLYAWKGGSSTAVKLVSPVFVDPEGARHNV